MDCTRTLTLPHPISARPWWRRWWPARPSRWGDARPPADYAALEGLGRATLKDIGAPDWMWADERRGPSAWEVELARWGA